jgi:hypothetical protein
MVRKNKTELEEQIEDYYDYKFNPYYDWEWDYYDDDWYDDPWVDYGGIKFCFEQLEQKLCSSKEFYENLIKIKDSAWNQKDFINCLIQYGLNNSKDKKMIDKILMLW